MWELHDWLVDVNTCIAKESTNHLNLHVHSALGGAAAHIVLINSHTTTMTKMKIQFKTNANGQQLEAGCLQLNNGQLKSKAFRVVMHHKHVLSIFENAAVLLAQLQERINGCRSETINRTVAAKDAIKCELQGSVVCTPQHYTAPNLIEH